MLALDYVGALTAEFFYFPDERKFCFNAINSRSPVEHCVTEQVTGTDVIREQIHIDEGIYESYNFLFYYDSLMMKLMSNGKTRTDAIARMKRALSELELKGVRTTIPFHNIILENADFTSSNHTTDLANRP